MPELEDLEQDVDALRTEIAHLTNKRDALVDRIQHNKAADLASHPIVKEFQSIFHQFPQLYDVLSRESSVRDGEVLQKEESAMKRKISEPITRTPKKQRLVENGNSPLIQHQTLDASIAKLINTDILNSPSKKSRNPKLDDGIHHIRDAVLLENVYRMFGISTFPVVDPSDLKLNDETKDIQISREMIGIRLEVFNERLSKYERPFYILLKKKMKSDSWSLFKHTVPQYIDVQALFNNTNGGLVASYSAIYLFSKEVYKRLVQLTVRMQKLEALADLETIEDLDVDLEAAAVSFRKNEARFRLLLQSDKIVSCSIQSNTIDASVRPQREAFFLGPIDELATKLNHFDHQ